MIDSTLVEFDIIEQRAHDLALELVKNKFFDDKSIADEDEVISEYARLFQKVYDTIR